MLKASQYVEITGWGHSYAMSLLVVVLGLALFLSGAVILAGVRIKYGGEADMGGHKAFECGFDGLGESRVGLSMRFFILVRLF